MFFGSLATAVSAQPVLDLGVATTRVVYYPGDELRLSVSVTNVPGGAGLAHFYTGVILPDGVTIATVGPSGAARLGTIAQSAAFLPVATGVPLGGPFAASVDPLFNYAWNGSEPLGAYQIVRHRGRRETLWGKRRPAGQQTGRWCLNFSGLVSRALEAAFPARREADAGQSDRSTRPQIDHRAHEWVLKHGRRQAQPQQRRAFRQYIGLVWLLADLPAGAVCGSPVCQLLEVGGGVNLPLIASYTVTLAPVP